MSLIFILSQIASARLFILTLRSVDVSFDDIASASVLAAHTHLLSVPYTIPRYLHTLIPDIPNEYPIGNLNYFLRN